jgi:hypothetical protein
LFPLAGRFTLRNGGKKADLRITRHDQPQTANEQLLDLLTA